MSEKAKNDKPLKRWKIAALMLINLILLPFALLRLFLNIFNVLSIQIKLQDMGNNRLLQEILLILFFCLIFSVLLLWWLQSPQKCKVLFNLLTLPILILFLASLIVQNQVDRDTRSHIENEFHDNNNQYLLILHNSTGSDFRLAAYQCNQWGMFCAEISEEDFQTALDAIQND